MAAKKWVKFPRANKAYDYAGDKLAKAWKTLHAGDQEPYPDEKRVAALYKKHPKLKEAGDAGEVAEALAEAWRAFHKGDFQTACDAGEALGPIGAVLATKAEGIYATYLAKEADRTAHYERCVARMEEAIAAMPSEANAHYFHAFALGRLSQCISVAKALAQGYGGKIKASLQKALELAPKHAEAHTALGLYHAEILDKIGAMIGGLTYGARSSTGLEHFEKAIELTPEAPIAYVEYAAGLRMMFGRKREADRANALQTAGSLKARDAMEALDIERAQDEAG